MVDTTQVAMDLAGILKKQRHQLSCSERQAASSCHKKSRAPTHLENASNACEMLEK
jgi:hypothetical protein